MKNRAYLAYVVWADSDGVEQDADEIRVLAQTEAEAKQRAEDIWRATFGTRWPDTAPIDVFACESTRCRRGVVSP